MLCAVMVSSGAQTSAQAFGSAWVPLAGVVGGSRGSREPWQPRRPRGAFEDRGLYPRAIGAMPPVASGIENQRPQTHTHFKTKTQLCREKRGGQTDRGHIPTACRPTFC